MAGYDTVETPHLEDRSFPTITGHGTEKALLMKFETLGLLVAAMTKGPTAGAIIP